MTTLAPASTMRRRAAFVAACRRTGQPAYALNLRMTRGRCLAKRCGSRWAVVRVSLDFRMFPVDRYATLECAVCGRTWRRCAVPAITVGGYQAVRLTLIVPAAGLRRWKSRGVWHREGTDSHVIADADIGDLDEAARAHRARAERKADAAARAAARKAEKAAALHAETMAWLDSMHAREAARAQEEAEAAARDAARGD